MLGTNRMIDAIQSALDGTPKGLHVVDVGSSVDILLGRMLDGLMPVANLAQPIIAAQFIRKDGRGTLGWDVGLNNGKQGLSPNVRHDFGNSLAVPFHHPEYHCLASRAASMFARPFAANVRLICLNLPEERVVLLSHHLADLAEHSPSRFVGDTQFALKLFGRNTCSRVGQEEHCMEPASKRRRGLMVNGVRCRMNVMTAYVTRIRGSRSYAVMLRNALARLTENAVRVQVVLEPLQTSTIIWKQSVEIFGRELVHCFSPYRLGIA